MAILLIINHENKRECMHFKPIVRFLLSTNSLRASKKATTFSRVNSVLTARFYHHKSFNMAAPDVLEEYRKAVKEQVITLPVGLFMFLTLIKI